MASKEQEKKTEEAPESVANSEAAGEVQDAAEQKPAAVTAGEVTAEDDRCKRVYVGNLSWNVSWQDLKDHMRSGDALDVTHASIITGPNGRSKGCGIVEYGTAEDAALAVEQLNNTELKGRQIFVREDRETQTLKSFSAGPEGKGRRVYVGNLSWDVVWQDLKDHMRSAGEVVHAEIIKEVSGRSKGCGIVEYATEEAAQKAINELSDTELNGRLIFVREDRESRSQGTASAGASQGGRMQHGSVFVWDLAPETSWQDLKDHMRRAGNVSSATILKNASGESNCCGVVVYQRPQDAARALRELQGTDLNGRPLNIREDRNTSSGRAATRSFGGRGRAGYSGRGAPGRGRGGPKPSMEGTQVFVANLAYETTWKELKDHFRQCGDVKNAEVKVGADGRSKGIGTVLYATKDEADAAVSRLNGVELQGRSLDVRIDQRNN